MYQEQSGLYLIFIPIISYCFTLNSGHLESSCGNVTRVEGSHMLLYRIVNYWSTSSIRTNDSGCHPDCRRKRKNFCKAKSFILIGHMKGDKEHVKGGQGSTSLKLGSMWNHYLSIHRWI